MAAAQSAEDQLTVRCMIVKKNLLEREVRADNLPSQNMRELFNKDSNSRAGAIAFYIHMLASLAFIVHKTER